MSAPLLLTFGCKWCNNRHLEAQIWALLFVYTMDNFGAGKLNEIADTTKCPGCDRLLYIRNLMEKITWLEPLPPIEEQDEMPIAASSQRC